MSEQNQDASAQDIKLTADDYIASKLKISADFLPYASLALQQYGWSLLRSISIENNGVDELKDLSFTFTAKPAVFCPKTFHLSSIKPNEKVSINTEQKLLIDFDYIKGVEEQQNVDINLAVTFEKEKLLTQSYKTVALPADQWPSYTFYPELICSFITPNAPEVNTLLSKTAEILQNVAPNAMMNGYASSREDVHKQITAIYRAITAWNISYALPPASFADSGQRIRLADNIAQYHIGTCLDTTLLFASVMEQAGLNPVIILEKQHAYVGCHLVKRSFQTMPLDDLQQLRKYVELDEFCVIETTLASTGSTFADAEAAAKKRLYSEEFEFAVDVARARASGILPICLNANGSVTSIEERAERDLPKENARKLAVDVNLEAYLNATSGKVDRVNNWQQKLLDLSLRNRLLNTRPSKQVVMLVGKNIAELEDKLSSGNTITLKSFQEVLSVGDLEKVKEELASNKDEFLSTIFSKEAFKNSLFSALTENELSKNLTAIYRQAKTDLEDGGVNTVFIALGFLNWKERPNDEKTYRAPLILVPVKIIRKSITDGFVLQRIDNEPIINVTLLELLKRQFKLDIGDCYESLMVKDEHGLDVNIILQLFRKLVINMKGWEVVEESALGIFSFGKFIMWTDMTERADALRANPLVNHLICGAGYYDDGIDVPDPATAVNNIKLNELYCPMSADSSQLAAVAYSAAGKSFVLHGPPGTGKSQTITNIIAHNLALGRRVLFVSEKKAALDVVHRRLSSIGLRPFCLELHSNKSGKTDVLKQFSEVLEYVDKGLPAEWDYTVSTMEELRSSLNGYVRSLHHVYPNGLSAHDCFAIILASKYDTTNLISFENILEQTQEEYLKKQEQIKAFITSYALVSAVAQDALEGFAGLAWNPQVEREWLDATRALRLKINALLSHLPEVSEILGVSVLESNIPQLEKLSQLLLEFSTSQILSPDIFNSDIVNQLAEIKIFVEQSIQRDKLSETLSDFELAKLENVSWDGISRQINENKSKWFIPRYFANNGLIKTLMSICKLGAPKLTIARLEEVIPSIKEYLSLKSSIARNASIYEPILAKVEYGKSLSVLKEKLDKLEQCVGYINGCSNSPMLLAAICNSFANTENSVWIKAKLPGYVQIHLASALTSLKDALEQYKQYSIIIGENNEPSALANLLEKVEATRTELRNALIFFAAKQSLVDAGLASLVQLVTEKPEAIPVLNDYFVAGYAQAMLEKILATNQAMASFSGPTQNEQIAKFCDFDDRYIELSKYAAVALLSDRLPRLKNASGLSTKTELGLLRRECEKKARQLPVRQLLARIPELLPSIKPCFLMSPLSVAQYLPSDTAQFDLVVFDEASQIPVWDAIGVIARGKQLIVVGDPKQMPPTSFFQKNDASTDDADGAPAADDDEIAEDMESILDECLAAGVHSTHLNWHYRSRHEELITFSNHHYYEDKLMTFPAAASDETLGVHFKFVPDGIYDRRSTRTNFREAEALVDYIFELFDAFGDKPRSVGVVTFSQAQKDLIEDIIDKRRAERPEYDKYFMDDGEEPFFVKNLENVQGDERDVILFSICYAKDKEGKFSMNFGPLNRVGGERRLNVAITRSKRMVVVFSSIHGYDIDTNRTAARGAEHLKSFLDYAEKGATFAVDRAGGSAVPEGLSETIAEFIKANGYKVERGVGLSGYRVDIAVVHPHKENVFMAGIECDGRVYAQQRTARDRDHIRCSVMGSLGWTLRREWSMDWTYDRQRAEKALLDFLHTVEEGKTPPTGGKTTFAPPTFVKEETLTQGGITSKGSVGSCEASCVPYKLWKPDRRYKMTTERFYEPGSCSVITRQINELVEEEGPITSNLLNDRIADAWGFSHPGDRITKIIGSCIPLNLNRDYTEQGIVYWAKDEQAPASLTCFRGMAKDNPEPPRTIENIITEELIVAMRGIYLDYHTTDKEVIYKEVLKFFGFRMVTDRVRPYLETAWIKAFSQ